MTMTHDAAEISVAIEELVRFYRRLNPAGGLSATAAATLFGLDRNGPARLTELAGQQGVSQPAMTQLITRMAEAGFVERVADPGDGRVVLVHVTAAGREVLRHRRAVRTTRLAALLDRLPAAQRDALAAAMPAIAALTTLSIEPERSTP
jgi:DNA-binding MarR family transcriptional regulator